MKSQIFPEPLPPPPISNLKSQISNRIADYHHSPPLDDLDPAPHDYYARAVRDLFWRAVRFLLLVAACTLFGIALGALITGDYSDLAVAAVSATAVLALRSILKLQ